jgi:NAD(P)-dependent dehydrogenase (short-subunit alcohol dehydrogenase family)
MAVRTALVTGAAQGLGLEIARAFLVAGYRVAAVDRNRPVLEAAVADLNDVHGEGILALVADVTLGESVEQAVSATVAWNGGIDVVVNCAGVIARAASDAVKPEQWQWVLDVNLGGTLCCTSAAFPHLRRSASPSVINIGSVGSFLGMPSRLAYNTSKTGVVGLTRTLAAEWGQHGIRVNAIAPGFIDTHMMRSGLESGLLDEQLMIRRIPMRRLGRPDEVGGVAVFLSSPAASYVTGVTIPVDGGTVIDGTFF